MVKKLLPFLLCIALILSFSTIASATYFYEEYAGYESIKEGESAFFKFDMWYENKFWVKDNTGLKLTEDAEGAFGDWSSASVFIDFYSGDEDPEAVNIWINAYGKWGVFQKKLVFKETLDPLGTNPLFGYEYNFNEEDLALFASYGWGDVNIKAIYEKNGVMNDFGVKRVAMGVSVPEPHAIFLMGFGLLGLAGMGRKKLFKK